MKCYTMSKNMAAFDSDCVRVQVVMSVALCAVADASLMKAPALARAACEDFIADEQDYADAVLEAPPMVAAKMRSDRAPLTHYSLACLLTSVR